MNRWHSLPRQLHSLVASRADSVLLQTARFSASDKRTFLFVEPVQVAAAYNLEEIPGLFRKIEQALADGLYAAGFLSYECGYHFERFNIALSTEALPLAWFGIYQKPLIYDHETGSFDADPSMYLSQSVSDGIPGSFADNVSLAIAEDEYAAKIRRIQEYISSGETYQVNFTDRVSVPAEIDPAAAFATLLRQQPVAYGAFLNVAGHHILSLSPELFFRIEQGRIVTRPMKGTMSRGLDAREDAEAVLRLQSDEKNRCEHVMIVDLLRNDLGRVCEMGSVQVDDLFSIETYQTLLQMTSTISGRLRHGLTYYDMFKGMFPSGSITGAPKIRTMEIIHEMEAAPRGIYTGSIGYMSPDGSSAFNVAIRTVDLTEGKAHMGVGGGIVADSDPQEEFRECLLKAEFLTRTRREFQLIETMLWNGDFQFLSMHLARMESSASYSGFPFDQAEIVARLTAEGSLCQPGQLYRVRLLLDERGNLTVTRTSHIPGSAQVQGRIRLSSKRTLSRDIFLRHKTTNRELYDWSYAKCQASGFDDVIFLNERDEITEGAISNIFIKKGGRLLTPPLRCGVLPGIYRQHLLESDPASEEAVLNVRDLESADSIYLCNSLRGLREVRFCPDADDISLQRTPVHAV